MRFFIKKMGGRAFATAFVNHGSSSWNVGLREIGRGRLERRAVNGESTRVNRKIVNRKGLVRGEDVAEAVKGSGEPAFKSYGASRRSAKILFRLLPGRNETRKGVRPPGAAKSGVP